MFLPCVRGIAGVGSAEANSSGAGQEDPFLSPDGPERSFASSVKTPTLTRIHLDMQTPGLLSKMTAPFGLTPETGDRFLSNPIRNENCVVSPQLSPASTSLELSRCEFSTSAGFTPEIKRTDEALDTLLKMQMCNLGEQLEESKRSQHFMELCYKEQIQELEGKLVDLANQHQTEMNAQRSVAAALETELAFKAFAVEKRKSQCSDKHEAVVALDYAIEYGLRELEAIRERKEVLRLALSSIAIAAVK